MLNIARLNVSIKATAAAALLVGVGIAITALLAVMQIRNSVAEQATSAQLTNLRTAALMLEDSFPELEVQSSGNSIKVTWQGSIPEFKDHAAIDRVGLATGETATIFAWDAESQDFWRRITNIKKPDGNRAIGTPLGQNGRVFPIVSKGETYLGEATILGKDYYTIYAPIFSASDGAQVVGILYAGVEKARIEAVQDNVMYGLSIGVVITMLVIVSIALLMMRYLLRPIPILRDVMHRLSNDDLDVEIPFTNRADDIGDVAHAVEVFKQGAIEKRRLNLEKEELDRKAKAEKTELMNQLADEFETNVGNVLSKVSGAATEMQGSAQQMSATADDASQKSRTVTEAAEHASSNVQAVASSAEELSASISEISKQMLQASDITEKAVENANHTRETIQGLAESAQKIGEVIKLITDIAEQTNLLALNATIEAARAGDTGKGFAVVASEVKTLANQTARATEEISAQIGAVQAETNKSVEAISGIANTVGDIHEIATSIASAVEEQQAATGEIARNVEQAASGTQDVSSNIGGVSHAASETGRVAAQILDATNDLSQQSETLQAEVNTFLEHIRSA